MRYSDGLQRSEQLNPEVERAEVQAIYTSTVAML